VTFKLKTNKFVISQAVNRQLASEGYSLLLSTYIIFILNFSGLMQTGELYKILIRLFNFLLNE